MFRQGITTGRDRTACRGLLGRKSRCRAQLDFLVGSSQDVLPVWVVPGVCFQFVHECEERIGCGLTAVANGWCKFWPPVRARCLTVVGEQGFGGGFRHWLVNAGVAPMHTRAFCVLWPRHQGLHFRSVTLSAPPTVIPFESTQFDCVEPQS